MVIDEAHKLRSAYRESNRMGQNIRWALEDRRKISLTATPLQNPLLELYGLSSIIDGRIFGDLPSFRTQFVNIGSDLEGLRERLKVFCKRTPRSHVLEYILVEKNGVTWVDPSLQIEVTYFEETEGGHFRFPVFKRILG